MTELHYIKLSDFYFHALSFFFFVVGTNIQKDYGNFAPGELTLQAIGVQQVLALLMTFDPALGAAHPLPGDPPQQTLTLVAIGGGGGGPDLEVVGGCAGNGVD